MTAIPDATASNSASASTRQPAQESTASGGQFALLWKMLSPDMAVAVSDRGPEQQEGNVSRTDTLHHVEHARELYAADEAPGEPTREAKASLDGSGLLHQRAVASEDAKDLRSATENSLPRDPNGRGGQSSEPTGHLSSGRTDRATIGMREPGGPAEQYQNAPTAQSAREAPAAAVAGASSASKPASGSSAKNGDGGRVAGVQASLSGSQGKKSSQTQSSAALRGSAQVQSSSSGQLSSAVTARLGADSANSQRPTLMAKKGESPQAPLKQEQAQFSQQVQKGLAAVLRQQGGSVTLRLTPDSLGTLKVQLDVRDGTVTARFEATSTMARDLLEQELPVLRQALESRGLDVERLQVVLKESQRQMESEQPAAQHKSPDERSRGHTSHTGDQRATGRTSPRRLTDEAERSGTSEDVHHSEAVIPEGSTRSWDGRVLRLNAIA